MIGLPLPLMVPALCLMKSASQGSGPDCRLILALGFCPGRFQAKLQGAFQASTQSAPENQMPERMPACDCGCGERDALFYFRFAAVTDSIAPIVETVSDLARRELDETREVELALALQEALANAIVHGSKRDPNKMVECWVSHGHSGILIVVRDSGPGFNPEGVPDPLSRQQLVSDHGRGLLMIRQLVDDVHFQRNGAEIHMRKA
jgi:serine/threonine-protein kinase RsbW